MKPSKQDETPPAGDSEEPRALTPHAPTIESGEWVRKGATLSDATALKEYGVNREFIVKGIRAGKLDYREGAIWGNPYLRLLRSQLELYIAGQHGAGYLAGRSAPVIPHGEGTRRDQEKTGWHRRCRASTDREKHSGGIANIR